MGYIIKQFFLLVKDLKYEEKSRVLKGFLQAFEHNKNASASKRWNQMAFSCYFNKLPMYLEKVETCLKVENFQTALILIGDLALPIEKAKLHVEEETDVQQLSEFLTKLKHA
jgi:hypothetical protein